MKKYYCPRCGKQMKEEILDIPEGFALTVRCECGFKKELWHATIISGGGKNETKTNEETSKGS